MTWLSSGWIVIFSRLWNVEMRPLRTKARFKSSGTYRSRFLIERKSKGAHLNDLGAKYALRGIAKGSSDNLSRGRKSVALFKSSSPPSWA